MKKHEKHTNHQAVRLGAVIGFFVTAFNSSPVSAEVVGDDFYSHGVNENIVNGHGVNENGIVNIIDTNPTPIGLTGTAGRSTGDPLWAFWSRPDLEKAESFGGLELPLPLFDFPSEAILENGLWNQESLSIPRFSILPAPSSLADAFSSLSEWAPNASGRNRFAGSIPGGGSSVPGPATFALLGLSGLLIRRSRRRTE